MSATAAAAPRGRLDDGLFAAAGLSWGAGLIHVVAAADHLHEYLLFAALLALLAPLQMAWGVAVCRRPDRRLLLAGAIGGLLVVAVWVVSRTSGLPLGPEPWAPEPVGLPDVAASADELAIALLVLLPASSRMTSMLRPAVTSLSILLVALSCLALTGGCHSH